MFRRCGVSVFLRCNNSILASSERLLSSRVSKVIPVTPSFNRHVWPIYSSYSGTVDIIWARHIVPGPSNTSASFCTAAVNTEKENIRKKVLEFSTKEGRRPRLLLTSLGRETHDRGLKTVANGLADLGFDIELGPTCITAPAIVRLAVDSDAHIVGVSCTAADDWKLVPEVINLLKKAEHDAAVIVGGVVPGKHIEQLRKAGVAAIFPFGVQAMDAAQKLLDILPRRESGPIAQ